MAFLIQFCNFLFQAILQKKLPSSLSYTFPHEVLGVYRCLSWFCYCCSVTKSYLTLCDPVDCSTPGFPGLHYLLDFAQTHVHWVDDVIQRSHLLCLLLLLPSIFPRIRVFSNESALHIRWPKYWSFSFSLQNWGSPIPKERKYFWIWV